MARAFQRSAFQNSAFQIGLAVTGTDKLQLPVDYFMEGLPQFDEGYSRDPGRGNRIKGAKPSFTMKTTKKGFD